MDNHAALQPTREPAEETLSFVHPGRRWVRIPIVLSSVAILYYLIVSNGTSPWDSGLFIFIFLVVAADSLIASILLYFEPKEIRISGSTVTLMWRNHTEQAQLAGVKIRRLPRLVQRGVSILSVERLRFVVFDDLADFNAFMNIIESSPKPSQA